jgi:hypothetical protein
MPKIETYSCSRCTNRWTSLEEAHCSVCHKTYRDVPAFDKHRPGYRRKGRCSPMDQQH